MLHARGKTVTLCKAIWTNKTIHAISC